MIEKDIKAVAKIINGVLYGTRWFNPMVETVGRYLEGKEYIENKASFKALCLNGIKSETSDETLVVYRPAEEKPEKRVFIDNNIGKIANVRIDNTLKSLERSKARMSSIIEKSYGYKKKKGVKVEQ